MALVSFTSVPVELVTLNPEKFNLHLVYGCEVFNLEVDGLKQVKTGARRMKEGRGVRFFPSLVTI